MHQLRQPCAADLDARTLQPLMQPIQGQMILKLVDEQAGQKAHICVALVEHRIRNRRTAQLCGVFLGCLELDDVAYIFQDNVHTGALGQTIGLPREFVRAICKSCSD